MPKTFTCPVCNKVVTGFPAISRTDNKTEICADCGVKQAVEQYVNYTMKQTAKKAIKDFNMEDVVSVYEEDDETMNY